MDTLDLDRVSLHIDCPRCGFRNPFLYGQARLGDVIICRGCKSNIQLQDSRGSLANSRRAIMRAVERLKASLEGFGTLTIS
ncbi:hypothetical protein CH330_00320 [candidate division WOR-3 bacterium JGI_Cruoil_03_51_56]|uniref:Uncharacterized protein n=1 Tax=candidate division WOR-3 bacterium JGI_Cruoil_03_51_56 TaxID=1973747 RepID=A0A235BYS7_UNCW3|nr:MAG: hypothetical protein CH330_00320 [candidate division WOR-3 bacterium JGI_Cruoil_03_51_56]